MSNDSGAAAVHADTRRLVSDFSIEVTPREIDKLVDVVPILETGTSVYLTYLPNLGFEQTLGAAVRVREQGLRPVCHLAVRGFPDLAAVDRALGRLADHGVADILLVAGSVAPAGSVEDTIQVLESEALIRRGFASIGVAGHPEGNPGVETGVVDEALLRKNKIAHEFGLPLHVVTQFCFSPAPIVNWERRVRAAGNELSVRVGVPGLTSPARLIKFGLSCGVGPSLSVLRKQAGSVARLATQVHRPDDMVAGLAREVANDEHSRIAGVHFFPFGAVLPTATWASAVRDGRFEVRDHGTIVTHDL